jgi:hypothetical protein
MPDRNHVDVRGAGSMIGDKRLARGLPRHVPAAFTARRIACRPGLDD